MLVPYKRLIACETEDVGDEDRSGVADPAWGQMNGIVRHRLNTIEAETNLLANECHLVIVNGILRHHVENSSILFCR